MKKIEIRSFCYAKLYKPLLAMKIILMLMILSVVQLSASVYSQNTRFNMKITNQTLIEVFEEIRNSSEFTFVYDLDDVEAIKNVDFSEKDVTVEEILDSCLENTNLTYEVIDKVIVVKQKPYVAPKVDQDEKKTIKGKVIDKDGESLPGVTITILGSTKGVTTDLDGSYEINVKPNEKLVFTFIGMESQIIEVGNETKVNVTMQSKSEQLDDVTVVAFGKQKKESVLSSIETVKPAELKIPSSNLTTALAGRMSGVISYQTSGEPGQDNATFFIRGITTFGSGKSNPLILIDGIELTSDDLARLHPDDIASFSIMKDATATALYGARGANGVVLITTREGFEGKMSISARVESSFSTPTKKIKLSDPITYMHLHNEAVLTRDPLGNTYYSQSDIDARMNPNRNKNVYPVTDWYDALFKDVAQNKRFNINIRGGGKKARYYVAGSFADDEGVLKVDKKNNFNNNIDLKRYSLRSNINLSLTPSTEGIIRFSGNFDDYMGPMHSGSSVYKMVMSTNPVLFPPYYEPDEFTRHKSHILFGNYDKGQYVNPYAEMVRGYKEYTKSTVLAQLELKQDLDFITKGLKFKGIYNAKRYSYFDVIRQYTPYYYTMGYYNKLENSYTLIPLNETAGKEWLDAGTSKKQVINTNYLETALSYNRIFDKNNVSGLLVFTMREQIKSSTTSSGLHESLPYRNLGVAGRFTYAYDNRYFGEFNFGYNGSERFTKSKQFGFFPSIGLGWIISNESFFASLKNTISKMKVKATYGMAGNDAIGSDKDRFFYLSEVDMNASNKGAVFGKDFTYSRNGISTKRYANPEIAWETAYIGNLGIELSFFNKLDMQVDIFREHRTNILMERKDVPITMGLQAIPKANVGESESKGIDISIDYNHQFTNDFWLTARGNFTYAKGTYKVYEEPDYNIAGTPWRSRIGQPIGQKWGYVAERFFIDDEEVRNSPTQFGDYRGGDIKYKDINKDGRITEADQVPIGYPTVPQIIYGFGFSIGYKNFDFSCFFQGSAKRSFWIDATKTSPFVGTKGHNALLDAYANSHWSELNRDVYALWPRLSTQIIANNAKTSTWFMRDAAFLRLKSMELGYTLPEKLAKKIRLKNARIYMSGLNLLTFSKFKLWDPEMGGNGLGYPIQKVYNIGLNIDL